MIKKPQQYTPSHLCFFLFLLLLLLTTTGLTLILILEASWLASSASRPTPCILTPRLSRFTHSWILHLIHCLLLVLLLAWTFLLWSFLAYAIWSSIALFHLCCRLCIRHLCQRLCLCWLWRLLGVWLCRCWRALLHSSKSKLMQ